MAVVIGGAGLGHYDVLGQAGIKLSSTKGLSINASTGNLVVQSNDQTLVSRGLDLSLARTYNSQGAKNDFDADNWRFSFERQIRAVGSDLHRITGDGHVAIFKKQEDGSYLSAAGGGAHDTIVKVGSNWVYTEGTSGIRETYQSADGKLIHSEDKHGNRVSYRYSGNRLSAVSNASGEELRFVYNSKGQLTRLDSYTQVDGKLTHSHSKVHYSYDSKGRLSQVKVDLSPEDKSISDGKVFTTTYTYQDANSYLLKSIQKSDGSKVSFSYQTVGGKNRLSKIDDNGIVTLLNYQTNRANGHQLQITDNNGEIWFYQHDDKGRLVSVLSPAVDYNGNVANLPRENGQVQGQVTYQYDDQDNLILVRDSAGKTIQNKYDAQGNLTEATRNGVLYLKNEYKNNLLVASHQYAGGKVASSAYFVYDQQNLRFEISSAGAVTEYQYNGFGQRISMRRYLGAALQATKLPALSALTSWASQQNQQSTELTEYTYQRGELHTQTTYHRLDTAGRGDTIHDLKITSSGYDFAGFRKTNRGVTIDGKHAGGNGRGLTITVVDASNKLISTKTFDTYGKDDASAQLVAYLKTLKATTTGHKIIVTSSDEWTHRLNQDAKKALSGLGIDPQTLKNAETRSAFMAIAEAKDGKWVTTHQDYRPRYPESTVNYTLTNAEHVRTTYDAFGNLIGTQTLTGDIKSGRLDVKSTTTQVFDGLNRITSTTDAAGNTVVTQYLDANRQVLVTTENGVTTRRTFSQRGELISETVSAAGESSRERQYIYNKSGQLVATQEANGSLSAVFYDDAGRQWITVSASGQITEYQRDSEGRIIREIQYNSSVNTQNWLSGGQLSVRGQDVLGLIDATQAHRVIRSEFDALGRLSRTIDAEQQVTEYIYDDLDRQIQVRHYTEGYASAARVLSSQYDNAGRLTEQKDADGFVKRFSYDASGKLTETRLYKPRGEMVYQNGHEVDLSKWEVYDKSPAGATMTPRYDAAYGGEVIDLSGSGMSNGYRFANNNANESWKNRDMRMLSWDMNFSQDMTVYISLQTEKGHRYIQYHMGTGGSSIKNGYAHHYIGKMNNGQWNTVTRDLEADLAAVEPDNQILHVNALLIRGTGSLGKVALSEKVAAGKSGADHYDSSHVFYDSRGRQQYALDEQGFLTETRYLDGGKEKVTYRYTNAVANRQGGIESILQQAGRAQQISRDKFDAAGRLMSSVNQHGIETRYQYDDVTGLLRQQISAANTKESRSVYMDYNKFGELTGRVAVAGSQDWKTANVTSLITARGSQSVYNTMGWKVSDYHPSTGKTSYEYDKSGRLIQQTDALGNTKSTVYTAFGQVKQQLVAGVVKSEYAYDKAGRVLRIVDGEKAVTSYVYNKQGHLGYLVKQHVSDAYQSFLSGTGNYIARDITHYRYDARGNVIEQRVAKDYRAGSRISGGDTLSDVRKPSVRYQAQWSRKYDHMGRVVSERDGAGREKIVDYLHGGRVKTVKLSGALQERIELDALGRTLSLANGKGETTRYEYDDTQNQVTVVSPGGIRTVTEKNAHGETTSITDALGHRRLFHYDHQGQLIRSEFIAAGSTTPEILSRKEYDANTGLLKFETNAEGTRTEFRYNAIGQQWKVIRDADGEKLSTEYGYDKQGLRVWENTEDQRTYIRYDSNGRKVRVEQGGVATLYIYDANGQVLKTVEGAVSASDRVLEERVTEFSYDANGNLTGKRIKSGADWSGSASSQTTLYRYDGSGKVLEKATAIGATTRYVYDALGRVKYEINALNYVTQFDYDAANRVVKTTRFSKAVAPQAVWTEASLKAAITADPAKDRRTETRYDNEGRVAFEIDEKGYATGYVYNANGQVSTTTQYQKTVHEANWNVSSSNNRVSQSVYDAHGRLQYAIDAQGRISERGYDKEGRITHTIRYNTDFRLANRSATSINALKAHLSQEVEAGRVSAELSVYDPLGRLRFAMDGDGFLVEYQYNRQSQKTRKKEYVDNTAVRTALNHIREGSATASEYAVFLQLTESLQSLDNASAELKAKLSELNHQQGRITSLIQELNTLEGQIAATNNANHDLGISIENANHRLSGLQNEVKAELVRHGKLQEKIDALALEIAKQEARLKGQNTAEVEAAKKAVTNADKALAEARSHKAQTAAAVQAHVKASVLTTLHPEWKADYTTTGGKIHGAVQSDAAANAALSLIAGHRDTLDREKATLQQQYQAALNRQDTAKATQAKDKLNQVLDAIELLDKLSADIQADRTARSGVTHAELALNAAKQALNEAIQKQNSTNAAINSNPTVPAEQSGSALSQPPVSTGDVVIPTPGSTTTETLDKIDALKSKLQILTAKIDAQKSTLELTAATLTQRENEYAVAREAYNKAQAERQAAINAAKKAVSDAQKVRDTAWAEYQAASKHRDTSLASQSQKQRAYNTAKANYDKALAAKNSAQSAANSANSALNSANKNLSAKQSAFNKAQSDYNYHHGEWSKANTHYQNTVKNRDAAKRARDAAKRDYDRAAAEYTAYSRRSWYTEENPSGKTSAGLNSRRATRDAKLRTYQSKNNAYNSWVDQANKAYSARKAKWDTRARYLNTLNAAKSNLSTATTQKNTAQANADKANAALADAVKAFEATKTPLNHATSALNSAKSTYSAANTRYSKATQAWKSAESTLAAKKKNLEETIATPQEQVDLAQAAYDSAIAEKAAAAQALKTATTLREQLSAQRTQLAGERAKAQSGFDAIEGSYQKSLREHTAAEKKLNDAEAVKRNSVAELTAAQNNQASITQDLKNAQDRYNKAVPEVNAAKSRLNSARQHLSNADAAYRKAVAGRHTNEEGHSWGTSLSEINSKRAARDSAANAVKARENEYNAWVSKRNAASNDINRLKVAKDTAATVIDSATKNYNAVLVTVSTARDALSQVSRQFESISAQYHSAEAKLSSTTQSHQQVEAQFAQAGVQIEAAQTRVSAAENAWASAKQTLELLTSNAAGDATTVQYEKETRLALQAAKAVHADAVSKLNQLQTERDQALEEQAILLKTLSEGGKDEDSLIHATVDSLDSANAVKAQAERDMLVNQQKVTDLKGQLVALGDRIEQQRNELEKQKRNYDEKLAAHEQSRNKAARIADELNDQNNLRITTELEIISWEEAKRTGAETIRASELNLAGKTQVQSNASHAYNSANSILSSNQAVLKQRQADREATRKALANAEAELKKATTHKSNTATAVKTFRSWGDAVWVVEENFRDKDAVYQHRLNNKYRKLSEEQGGGSVGYTQAQIDAAFRDRKAAADLMNGFKHQFTSTSGAIYQGPDSKAKSDTALKQQSYYQEKVKSLADQFYARYKHSLSAKNTNEEGVSSNAYTQAQINAFKAESDRAARGLKYVADVRTKLNDDIDARTRLEKAQSEVNRLKGNLTTTESALAAATSKVDQAQADVNAASSVLNTANQALAAAKQKVADAHATMDQAEIHLAKAREKMDGVEDSIVTIRQLLDVAKSDESKALAAVVAARKELNVAQGDLNTAKGELNTTVSYLNKVYADLDAAMTLHHQVSAYLDRATTYKDRAGATLSEAQQLVYLSKQAVSREINAGTVSHDTDYRYDARGQLISELSATVSYVDVSADGKVIQHIGRLETRYQYDSLGNVIASTTAAGTSMANTKRFVFNVMGNQTQAKGLAGSSVIYNEQNLASVNINAENGRRDKVYDQLGQLRFDVDELGFVTEYRYDGYGQKTAQTRYSNAYSAKRPEGTAIALSELEKFVAQGGVSRTLGWQYDQRGQEISATQSSSVNSDTIRDDVAYNAFGEKVSTTRRAQNVSVTTGQHLYSLTGQLLATRNAEGYVTAYGYNGQGQLVEQREFTNRFTGEWSLTALEAWQNKQGTAQRFETYGYDHRGNRTQVTRHNVVYHAHNGNTVTEKKGDLITTTYHDYAGRMYMTVQETDTVNAANHATAANRVLHEFDALGRLVTTWGKKRDYVVTSLSLSVAGGNPPERDSAHQRTDYLYDAQGNQVSTMTEGRSTFQYFNQQGQLTGRKDAEGNYTRIETDAMNRVVGETVKVSSSGALSYSFDRVTRFSYDKTGRQTATTVNASSGNIAESSVYNAFGEVTEKRLNNVVQEKYQYDGFGQVTTAERKGITSNYQYNWLGKVIRETTGGSRVVVRDYDKMGNLTREQGVSFDGKSPVTTQVLDRFGNVLSRNVNGSVYQFKYNQNNQVIEQTGPEVATVDAKGALAKRKPITKMYYDLNGNRIAVQDSNGHWQKSTYDLAGQKLSDINGAGGATYYYHDARGDMVGRMNTLGQGELFTYNNNGQLLSRSRLGLDNKYAEVYAKYSYDQLGQRYSEEWVGETGYTQWTRFDQAGRVLETKGGGQHQKFTYDVFGNKTSEAWLDGGNEKARKRATFSNTGRLLTETLLDGSVISYSYDAFGQVTRKSGGGMDIRFEYYTNGLLKKQVSGTKRETYVYDVNGKETQRTLTDGDQQLVTVSQWDSHGRLASIGTTAAKGFGKTLEKSSVTYQYDAVGNRRKVASKRGTTSETRWYQYDGDNRMVASHQNAAETQSIANKAGSRQIQYNAAGQKEREVVWTSVTRDGKKAVVKQETLFGYDVNGHIQSIQSYEYNGSTRYRTRFLTQTNSRTGHALAQNELTTTYKHTNGLIRAGSGKTDTTKTTYVYSDGRLKQQDVVTNNKATQSLTFTYHFSGQLAKQQTNVIQEKFTETYVYDYRGKESFQKVKITATRDQKGYKTGVTDFRYNSAGHLTQITSTKDASERKLLTGFNGQIALQLEGGKLSAELAVGGNSLARLTDSKLDADLLSDSAAGTGAQPGAYIVKGNDTLQRISQAVYGDSRYWYLIADANGLSPSDKLVEGKSLVIPNQHTQTFNGAESFKPYNESEVLGNVNPDPIAPPPPKKSCNPIAMIVMVVVAVVVTIYTAGAAAPMIAGMTGGVSATAATTFGVGMATLAGGGSLGVALGAAAIGGAIGSAASQLVGKGMGVVDDFSWSQVALGGLAAAATAGVGHYLSGGQTQPMARRMPGLPVRQQMLLKLRRCRFQRESHMA
ncbi:LysM peptidoglycan-binding domain-containing protein [Photobacterium sp. GJ3]|uniref:interleukin-like EMT inducer domain-containing protein n=1 Tax=Photobacterium sp. GJ3 TaxID=2829502 RepID=UPI001B8C9FA5|nr:interleukin-like EMT inducer domain-containing protein [Photobacterium sp. GJ3]QUJ68497.1 LysM peptidoglycan-binding domain-containing protein [Photobacterium sp. GJ3]